MSKGVRPKTNGKSSSNGGKKHEEQLKERTTHSKLWIVIALFIAVVFSVAHYHHLQTLFENDRHFSHLADMEREMAFRTEMGLYFSYYKTIINAPTFWQGLYEITNDNVTEYGHTINTLKRFNLYPEVILSFAYRHFKDLERKFDWKTQTCFQINRGEGYEPVESCEGIGNSHYFYVDIAFGVVCTVVGTIFLLGYMLSDSLFGGLLSTASFFFNHGEATRAQWTPSLRETFGFPAIIAQILVVTYILKNHSRSLKWVLLMSFFGVNAMLSWQFSQFAFFTQVGSLFVVYAFDFVNYETLKTLATGHLVTFIVSYIALFGNEMLLAAMYFPSILALMLLLFFDPALNKISLRPLYLLLSFSLFIGATLFFKVAIAKGLNIEDDAHIIDILRSKFTDFANFHTRLYTCSAEFDFLKVEVYKKLSVTLLIPTALLGVFLFICYFFKSEFNNILWRETEKGKEFAEVFYNVVQLLCYTVMTVLIMRLKLFFTPHLCVLAALVANKKILESLGIRLGTKLHWGLLVLILAVMANEGKKNLDYQWGIRGEYSNPEQEHLFNWIIRNTKKDAVFAGTMPVMANVKLSTERPIVNHPHYEDVGIRERTLKIYSMFSRKPIEEVHSILKEMGVNYFIFQLFNCAPDNNRPHCAYRGMWDEQDPENAMRPSLCDIYHYAIHNRDPKGIEPFRIVYNPRNNYIVLKI